MKFKRIVLTIFLILFIIPLAAFAQEVEVVVAAPDAVSQVDPLIAWLSGHAWFAYVMMIVVAVKSITPWVPTNIQGKPWYNVFMRVVNYVALNFGKDKNADMKPLSEVNR